MDMKQFEKRKVETKEQLQEANRALASLYEELEKLLSVEKINKKAVSKLENKINEAQKNKIRAEIAMKALTKQEAVIEKEEAEDKLRKLETEYQKISERFHVELERAEKAREALLVAGKFVGEALGHAAKLEAEGKYLAKKHGFRDPKFSNFTDKEADTRKRELLKDIVWEKIVTDTQTLAWGTIRAFAEAESRLKG